jgi:uncharacterized low-complexity protein
MKKQILAAAVAASVSAVAIADISITGNAKYEYKNTEYSEGYTANSGNTEINLSVVGKTGDTKVVYNIEQIGHGSCDNTNSSSAADSDCGIDVEDNYIETKIGDFTIKGGNMATGTSHLLGELDEGSRVSNKVAVSTNVGGVGVAYSADPSDNSGATVTLSTTVQGVLLEMVESSNTYTAYGARGSLGGVNFRVAQKNHDSASSDESYVHVDTKVGDITVAYAQIEADTAGLLEESDGYFQVDPSDGATIDEVKEFKISMPVAGNTVSLYAGTVGEGATDNDYTKIAVNRKLASGATLDVSYLDKEDTGSSDTSSTEILEIDLSVSF